MATLNLENVPDELYERLQQLAWEQHRSLDAQIIALLEKALATETPQTQSETPKKSILEILEESRRRRVNPTDFGLPDSTALIREDRDR